MFKVTGYLGERFFFFAKKNFEAKLNISSLASFSRKNILHILRHARLINKKVFTNEILSPIRVLQADKNVSGLPVMFFAVKHPESFISCRFSSFCSRLQLVIYSHQVFAWVRFAYRV